MSNEELISQSPFGNKSCSCGKIYTNRNLVAPDCIACNYADEVRELMDAARKDERNEMGYFRYIKSEHDAQIKRIAALGINTTGQEFEQMINALIFIAEKQQQ